MLDIDHPSGSAQSRDTMRLLALAGAFLFCAIGAYYVHKLRWINPIPLDGTGLVVGRDFLNFWMYGRAFGDADPGRFYTPETYWEALHALLGPDYPNQTWSYPPNILLLAAPFGALPYLAALALWTAASLAVFAALAVDWRRNRRLALPLLFSPAAILCLLSGQSSFATAALMIGAFRLLDRRPALAGVLIGLLAFKPQLALLFPFWLIAARRWRVVVAAALTVAVLVLATAAVFGPQIWIDYVVRGIPGQNLVLRDPDILGAPFMPTIFMNLRTIGASYEVAMGVQAIFSVAGVAIVIWLGAFRREAQPALAFAMFLACSVFAAPYLLSYDTLALATFAVMLINADRVDPYGRVLALLVYFLPLLQLAAGGAGLPGPALIPLLFTFWLIRELRREAGAACAPSAALAG
jgi:arabinofuranan 3-O-arabinosyltransferase